KPQWTHIGEGIFQQQPAFMQGFVNQMKAAVLQITQPAVHQLRRNAAGAGGEIAFVDKRGSEAPKGRIQRHSCARDTAPHDQEIEPLVSKRVDLSFQSWSFPMSRMKTK